MHQTVDDSGIYLGMTVSGSNAGLQIHMLGIEYQDTAPWGEARGTVTLTQ
jgi:hypothetical protein